MADSIEPCKMLWADHCCHGNEIRARRGDLVAYRLVQVLFTASGSTALSKLIEKRPRKKYVIREDINQSSESNLTRLCRK